MKKNYLSILSTLLWTIYSATQASSHFDPTKTLKHLLRVNPKNISSARHQLIACLAHPDLPEDLAISGFDRLFDFDPPAYVIEHEELLLTALRTFNGTPGFKKTLKKILANETDTLTCLRHLYYAYALMQQLGESIESLHAEVISPEKPYAQHVVDIISSKTTPLGDKKTIFNACRNNLDKKAKQTRRELKKQTAIAATTETPRGKKLSRLVSNEDLSKNWQKYLHKHPDIYYAKIPDSLDGISLP